ncbi:MULTISPECIES: hypothetical protein [Ectothiorhodospira]|uniref:hypothetical protein n=1 Tax=Ectothiorhodospira TaxID=1051 RepID=UPI000FFC4906|nr:MULTISPECIES: hypothetical protein [Ectothiorhodospira]MCG5495474.1 hypothetical protein [Ectothiorhodospira variabilis]MCG5498935.1 hypothetical protein [Ectothiorhodospira variabilis]MCG5503917.1 hypothetical protein [Ectothiorhodospira variabilis]MCG5506952.1 hypothetical protein [Ectothiorhodospira variabilis]
MQASGMFKIDNRERLRRIAQAVPGGIHQFERRPDGSTRMPYVSRKLWELYDIDPEIVIFAFYMMICLVMLGVGQFLVLI